MLRILNPVRFFDNRGYFSETFNYRHLKSFGIDCSFVQDNQSLSHSVGTLRGLHFQSPPFAQSKLVRCGRGAIFDVAVDIRVGSPTYGLWEGFVLSEENGLQLFIPAGYAHGFITLAPDSEILYKCSDYYNPESEGALLWNSCGIDWPVDVEPVLSEKDSLAVPFENFSSPFIYGENV